MLAPCPLATTSSGRKDPSAPSWQLAQLLPPLFSWFDQHLYRVVIDRELGAVYSQGPEVVDRKQMATRLLDFVVVLGGEMVHCSPPHGPSLSRVFPCSGLI